MIMYVSSAFGFVRAFAAVGFDDVQLVARCLVPLELVVRHVIGHEPEARPGADGVRADEPAFKVAREPWP